MSNSNVNMKFNIVPYNKVPVKINTTSRRQIADFTSPDEDKNIDMEVVKSFGEEWNKFHHFQKKQSPKFMMSILILSTNR